MAMLNNQMVIELMVLGINLMVGWLMIQLAGRLYQGLEHAWWTNDSVLVTWVFTSKSKLSWLSLMCMPASENRSFWMEKWLIPQFPSISQFFGALHSLCIDGQYCIKPVLQVWTSEYHDPRWISVFQAGDPGKHQIFEHLGVGQTYLSLHCVFFRDFCRTPPQKWWETLWFLG